MKTPFEICFSIITDPNIQTNKSGYDCDMLRGFREHFEEVFKLNDEQYKEWWRKLDFRTDISDDDKWELETMQDDFHLLLNVRDNLRKSGVFQ